VGVGVCVGVVEGWLWGLGVGLSVRGSHFLPYLKREDALESLDMWH